jgi:hypothetical protein
MEPVRFNHIVVGEIVESDLIITTPEEWAQMPESQTGAWSVFHDETENRILANRLLGVPVFTGSPSAPTRAVDL